jgi:hypothetical protein
LIDEATGVGMRKLVEDKLAPLMPEIFADPNGKLLIYPDAGPGKLIMAEGFSSELSEKINLAFK